MTRDTSEPPSSDDSAVGSMASSNRTDTHTNGTTKTYSRARPILTNQDPLSAANGCSQSVDGSSTSGANEAAPMQNHVQPRPCVAPEELRMASNHMRYNITRLLSRSIRTNLSCFDDLDVRKLTYHTDYLVNFIVRGINHSVHSIQRPVSILWPDDYRKMTAEVAKLDALLINTELREDPIEWMLLRGLTRKPDCKHCKNPMGLVYQGRTVSWRCSKTEACRTIYAPVQRPLFFEGHETVGLIKLLFAIYYWSMCTQVDLLHEHLRVAPQTLSAIYESIQNVCRLSLEKSYPRYRLCNNTAGTGDQSNIQLASSVELIDLISIKLNDNFIVCAKNPKSNCVRLGLLIPNVSQYKFASLTESWFAHGAKIRVCETKFLPLKTLRTDLTVVLTSRTDMVTKDGAFHRDSAFGYIVCQLAHIFKDFDSSKVPTETVKLILAELEWRELYGTTPYDAFTNIVEHIATYRDTAPCYYPMKSDTELDVFQNVVIRDEPQQVWTESYFYASMVPLDSQGNEILKFVRKENFNEYPITIVQFACHLCSGSLYESFYLTMHIIAHVEFKRKENEVKEFQRTRHIKCKHCFKKFKKREIVEHSKIFRTDYMSVKFGCRICCIGFGDRSKFLDHMRRTHFQQEMPYRCPSCKFASSIQRETIIHFQEEHQQDYVILCTFCLRSFTVPKPGELNAAKLTKISQAIYNHIHEHYGLADSFSCDKCCLSFLSAEKLRRHKRRHHNPMEVINEKDVRVRRFIVTAPEEEFSVSALPMELFIPNKRPNMPIDETTQATSSINLLQGDQDNRGRPRSTARPASLSDDDGDSSDGEGRQLNDFESETIHVGPTSRRFLDGGNADLRVLKHRPNKDWTTEKIVEALSKLARADCIAPNQSVIITPDLKPSRCIECKEFITVDHYVAAIQCKSCKYETHCPRAATAHKQSKRHLEKSKA